MNSLKFRIISPDKIVYEANIREATLPTKAGEITVLPDHTPLVSLLDFGEVKIKKEDDEYHSFAVSRGVVEIKPGSKLYLLTDFAEHAGDIDIEKAEKARARAEQVLENKDKLSREDFAHFEGELARELAKIKVGRRWRG